MSFFHIQNTEEGFVIKDRNRGVVDGPFRLPRTQVKGIVDEMEKAAARGEDMRKFQNRASLPRSLFARQAELTWWREGERLITAERQVGDGLYKFVGECNPQGQWFAAFG